LLRLKLRGVRGRLVCSDVEVRRQRVIIGRHLLRVDHNRLTNNVLNLDSLSGLLHTSGSALVHGDSAQSDRRANAWTGSVGCAVEARVVRVGARPAARIGECGVSRLPGLKLLVAGANIARVSIRSRYLGRTNLIIGRSVDRLRLANRSYLLRRLRGGGCTVAGRRGILRYINSLRKNCLWRT
jgi:hypothetical protein